MRTLCHALEIHPSGFYAWLSNPVSKRAKEDEYLLGFIKQYWLKSGCIYGYRKIYKNLRAAGDQCGKNRVYRLMRTEGLQAQRGYKRKNNYGGGDLSTVAPNLLNREFNVEKPNTVWVTDITYIRTQEGRPCFRGWLHLCRLKYVAQEAPETRRTTVLCHIARYAIPDRGCYAGLICLSGSLMVSPVAELQTVVELILSQNPEGLSEHSLINLLQQEPHCFFDEQALRDSHTLFQTHFLLFHCLYRLQKQWAEAGLAVLEISPLKIIKRSFEQDNQAYGRPGNRNNTNNNTSPEVADPLQEYYLNWEHFDQTSAADVDSLLKSFWRRMLDPAANDDALEVLELSPPVEWSAIRQQYRRLAAQHHPDKGGDAETFKAVCTAFHQLKQQYQP